MTNLIYNDPERDVRIDAAYRGDIRCRKLTITATGSVVGNIEAFDVRNFGRIQGVVNATDVFINSENAVARGSVFARHIGTHPNSTFECSTSHRFAFRTDTAPSIPTPSALERAIQEGVARELARAGLAADHQGFAISANTTFRTPDGKLHAAPAREAPLTEFNWAPSAPTRKEFADGREYTVVSQEPAAKDEPEHLDETAPTTGDDIGASSLAEPSGPDPIVLGSVRKSPDPIQLSARETIKTPASPTPVAAPVQRRPLPPLFAGTN
jgi:hypothetical protein